MLIQDPLLQRDDNILIDPLREVLSLGDYVKLIREGKIWDIQPLRDLSFYLNIIIEKYFGFGGFHLLNFMFFILMSLSFYNLLKTLKIIEGRLWITALFICHPIIQTYMFWVSSRKHLLSTLFILLATNEILKKKNRLKPLIYYFLSLLSQPINILWPSFKLADCSNYKEIKNKLKNLWLYIFVMLTMGFVNFYYYSIIYNQSDEKYLKFQSGFLEGFRTSLLGLGRSFAQIFFPLKISPIYYLGSVLNIFGLLFLVLFSFFVYKAKIKNKSLWTVFIISPLIVIYARMTNVFVSDTYLSIPLIGVLIFFGEFFKNHFKKAYTKIVVIIFCLFLFFQSFNYSKAWQDDFSLWEYAYSTEKTPQVLLNYGSELLKKEKYIEAFEVAKILFEWDKGRRHLPLLLSKSLYKLEELRPEKKVNLFEKYYLDNPWYNYYYGAFLASMGNWNMACDFYLRGLKRKEQFKNDIGVILKEAKYISEKSTNNRCRMNFLRILSDTNK